MKILSLEQELLQKSTKFYLKRNILYAHKSTFWYQFWKRKKQRSSTASEIIKNTFSGEISPNNFFDIFDGHIARLHILHSSNKIKVKEPNFVKKFFKDYKNKEYSEYS